jgi:hypothetical protein
MQQKFLWGAAALFMMGAAATYLAVDYAFHHPASMLARVGIATVFAGLNPNPLCDVTPVAVGGGTETEDLEFGQDLRPLPPTSGRTIIVGGVEEEETIEPIQIEALPFPTAEPPTQTPQEEEKGFWDEMVDRFTGENCTPTTPLECPEPTGSTEQAPRRMPYADEDEGTEEQSDGCPLCHVLRGLSALRSLMPSAEAWQAAEEYILGNGCGGCLSWFEYCAPEQVPAKPCHSHRCNDEQNDEAVEHTCPHGCGDRCGHCGDRPCWPPKETIEEGTRNGCGCPKQTSNKSSTETNHEVRVLHDVNRWERACPASTTDRIDGGIAPRAPEKCEPCGHCGDRPCRPSKETSEEVFVDLPLGPVRRTEVIQLQWAKAADVVTAVQTYAANMINACNSGHDKPCEGALTSGLVIVAEPITNKIVLNASTATHDEILALIRKIDKQSANCSGGCCCPHQKEDCCQSDAPKK